MDIMKNITCKGIKFSYYRDVTVEVDKNRSVVDLCPLRNGNVACWIMRR